MNYSRTWRICSLALVLVLIAASMVPAAASPLGQRALRYVDLDDGSDDSDCSNPGEPCQSIGYALAQSLPSDQILVAGGTYSENLTANIPVSLEGGYSGVPDWTRDLDLYETIIHSDSPTQPGDWDGAQVRYPTVTYDGVTYEMWYTGIDMFNTGRLGYATSPDGVTWTKYGFNPVLDVGPEGAWDSQNLEGSSVIKAGPNAYQMWYSGLGSEGWAIGYAESGDGVTWTKHPDPIVVSGGEAWNNAGVLHPSVLYEGGLYKMWFLAMGDDGGGNSPYLAYATSPDGLSWTWHPDPLFGRDWEEWFWAPRVLFEGGDYHLWYSVWAGGEGHTSYAVSPNGLDWTKHGAPVLSGTPGEWDEGAAVDPGVLYDAGTFRLWYDSYSSIGAAESPNPFDWVKLPENPLLEPGYYGVWGEPVVRFESGSGGSVLDGFTVTGAEACNPAGGVSIQGIQVTIAQSSIRENVAMDGCGAGGIEVTEPTGHLILQDSEVADNEANDGGGLGIWDGASAEIYNSAITGNTTRSGPGGGISVAPNGTLWLEGSLVADNIAHNWGGGIHADGATVTLTGVDVLGNHAVDGEGGGLVFWSGTTADLTDVAVSGNVADHGAGGVNVGEGATLTLERVQINGNESAWGTGLRVYGGGLVDGHRVWIQDNVSWDENQAGFQVEGGSTLNLHNALITGNAGSAGGLWDGAQLTLNGVTLADNSRGDGWGGVSVSGDSFATVRNSILVYNGNADFQCDDPGTCTVEFSDLQHPWPGPGNISTNPRFVDRASGDYHLETGSPCIDAAELATAPGDDLDGDVRPYDGDDVPGALPDMGADEYTGPPAPIEPLTDVYVDGTVGPGGMGTPDDPYPAIWDGIWNAFEGDALRIADGTYLENVELSRDLSLVGGYSGLDDPYWVRDPDLYPTIVDGSANPSVPGDWDGANAAMPGVIYDPTDSLYKMYYAGTGNNHPWAIGLATSPDGQTWSKYGGNPILVGDNETWEGDNLQEPYVWMEGPGDYRMVYDNGWAIGYATSSDGITWTRHPDPVLEPDPNPAAWDMQAVKAPSVVWTGVEYLMAYTGQDESGVWRVGVATSDDLLNWARHPANPVLEPGAPGSFDENGVYRPDLALDGGTFHLLYVGSSEDGGQWGLGVATSSDGIGWDKYPGNPVLPGDDPWENQGAWGAGHFLDGVEWKAWYVAFGDEGSGIGLATSADGLDWVPDAEHNPVLEPGWYGEDGAPVVRVTTPWEGGALTPTGERLQQLGEPLGRGPQQDRAQVMLDGLILTGGTFWNGAGLNIDYADVMVEGCSIVGNEALSDAGGVGAWSESTLSIHASEVLNNTAQNWSAGIDANDGSTVTLEDVDVFWNHAVDGEAGGVHVGGEGTTATLLNVAIVENEAGGGGAGLNLNGGAAGTAENLEIAGNVAPWGAGLRLWQGTLTANRVSIVGNVADDGGGMAVDNFSQLTLTNALIGGNEGGVGGIGNEAHLTLINSTVADNTHPDGWGGLWVYGGASAEVLNSILVYNGNDDLGCEDPMACTVEFSNLQHPWPGPGNISTNPRFVDRATGDYHLEGGSPCIDAAEPAYAPPGDLDGDMRPYDGDDVPGALPDMGADEYTGTPLPIEPLTDLYVDGDAPQHGNGTPDLPYATVGEGIGAAFGGDTVHVADGVYVENVHIGLDLDLLGGYSGVPDWFRNPEMFETVLDGSASPSVPGEWDGADFGMPNVIYDPTDSLYKMYYAGTGNYHPWAIGLATSPDAYTWTKYGGNPILTGDDGTWEGDNLQEPFVWTEGPGDYRMVYDNGWAIGYATSGDGITWTKHPDPVLEPDPNPAAWDSQSVKAASLVWTGAEYLMAYIGQDEFGVWRVGVATSSDLLNWVRHPANPVLEPGAPGEFDENGVYRPDLAFDGSTFHLLYVGISQDWGQWRLGVATSPDGIAWTKYPGNPVLPGDDPWENQGAWGAGHFLDGSEWKVWYVAAGDEDGGIGLATSADGLDWIPDSEHNPVLQLGWYGEDGAPVVRIHDPQQDNALTAAATRLQQLGEMVVQQPTQDPIEVLVDGLTITNGQHWDGAGVLVNNANATLQGCTIANNAALSNGGGIYVGGDATALITATTVLNNTAGDQGGGIWNQGPTVIDRSWIEGNTSTGFGGGLTTCCPDGAGETTLQNTFLVGNHAQEYGGAISPFWFGTLMNVTVADNTCAEQGCLGGVDLASDNPGHTHTLVNSIFYFNDNWDLGGEPSTSDVSYCDVYTSTFELTGPGVIDDDPLFGADYHLTLASPPRDAGTPVGAPGSDYDGEPRPFEPGTLDWDMGADEWWPVPNLVVTPVTPLQQSGLPESSVVYTFTVTNSGNYTDTFGLSLAGYEWPTQLSTSSTGPLWVGQSATFTVTVDVPSFGLEWIYGSDTYHLAVASGWPAYPVAVLAGTTQAAADLAVSIGPAMASGEGAAGEVVAYTLTVSNTGQYQDDYTLSVSSGWTAQLSTLTLTDLEPQASATVILSVTVPQGASGGDADTATVTVQSATDAAVTDQAQATTSVEGYTIFLPLVARND